MSLATLATLKMLFLFLFSLCATTCVNGLTFLPYRLHIRSRIKSMFQPAGDKTVVKKASAPPPPTRSTPVGPPPITYCSDEWSCDEDGCFVVLDSDGGLTPAFGETVKACAVEEGEGEGEGGSATDQSRRRRSDEVEVISQILSSTPQSDLFSPEECRIIWADDNDAEAGFQIVCDIDTQMGNNDRWKMLISEEDRRRFSEVFGLL